MELMDYFAALSSIPRPSGGEVAVTAYLADTLAALGLAPEMDGAHNLRCLLPAAPGREHAPGVILQAHTDMVCVGDGSGAYRPGRDPVALRRDGAFLRSDGHSSLGADNGIAAAAMLALAEHRDFDHGPVLLLFTACEEKGLLGAKALDPSWLEGFSYYVNLDAFRGDAVIFASAGGLRQRWSRPLCRVRSEKDFAFTVELQGLTGGHSGFDIHRGRGNAIALLLEVLDAFPLEIARLEGGSDFNAIPTAARAVVTVENPAAFRACIDAQSARLALAWGATDPGLRLTAAPCPLPAEVWDETARRAVTAFFSALPAGVLHWRQDVADTVASSGNPAVLREENGSVVIDHFARCDSRAALDAIARRTEISARENHFTRIETSGYSPWAGTADSPLTRLARRIYRDLTGEEMEAVALHVGLESSLILEKNPALTGIALGCDIFDAHSVSERVRLDSIPRMEQMILRLLDELSKEDGI